MLCSQHIVGTSTSQKIAFMTCWDDNIGSRQWEATATQCSSSASIPFDAVSKCAKGGDGQTLLVQAAAAWDITTHPCGGKFGVPRVTVDGLEQGSDEHPPETDGLVQALCSKHITADACNKLIVT